MNFVCFNGEIIEKNKVPFDQVSRAFKFGDGLFETIRIFNGHPVYLDAHYKRLFKGMSNLQLEYNESFSSDFITQQISSLISVCNIANGGKVRLSIFRTGEGAYSPLLNDISFLIEVNSLNDNEYVLNKRGLNIDLYNDLTKSTNFLSSFKTSNSILYVLASIYAKKNNLDDILIINNDGNIIESTNSNIFISINGVLYTPPLSEGCIGGIMRMKLINLALTNKIPVYENKIKPQHLISADEVLLTNTINGVRWIGKYKEKRYFNSLARLFTDALNEDIVNYHQDLMEN